MIFLISGIAVLMMLTRWAGRAATGSAQRWPLNPHGRAYYWAAAAPLAVLVYLGALVTAIFASGVTDPLPYLPWISLAAGTVRSGRAGASILETGGTAMILFRIEADQRTAGFAQPAQVDLLFDPVELLIQFSGNPPYMAGVGVLALARLLKGSAAKGEGSA